MELQRTKDVFTAGLCNVTKDSPLSRFFFFELDEFDTVKMEIVLDVYRELKIPVYCHRTMRGYHFFSLHPIPRELHQKYMLKIKHLNPLCPHVTLRVKANKWENELDVFKNGFLLLPDGYTNGAVIRDMQDLRRFINTQNMYAIEQRWKLVHYRIDGVKKK